MEQKGQFEAWDQERSIWVLDHCEYDCLWWNDLVDGEMT